MRKSSRRSTIFLVALGVLLTASIAFAAVVAVSGSDNFTIATADDTTQNPPQPLVVDINRRPNNGTGPISENDVARYRIDITNPNGYPVDSARTRSSSHWRGATPTAPSTISTSGRPTCCRT